MPTTPDPAPLAIIHTYSADGDMRILTMGNQPCILLEPDLESGVLNIHLSVTDADSAANALRFALHALTDQENTA